MSPTLPTLPPFTLTLYTPSPLAADFVLQHLDLLFIQKQLSTSLDDYTMTLYIIIYVL